MILAVLEARCGVGFGDRDVYLNVAGGLKVTEPAADLAAAAALVSSALEAALPQDCVVFGEISLSGDVRPVSRSEMRLKEAAKLGFSRALSPAGRRRGGRRAPGSGRSAGGRGRADRRRGVGRSRPMTLFDLAAGLVLIVSVLVGWFRGAAREVATVAALIVAAIVALFGLRFSGPIARHAIATPWLANIAAILIVFAAVYIVLRVAAGALAQRIHQTGGVGDLDRIVGAGFGAARALVVLGLANLTINAITPPDRMPPWISGALLWPVSALSASALKTFAPRGADLAKKVYPVVGKAITDGGQSNQAGAADDQNRDYNDPQTNAPGRPRLRVEKTP